MSFSAAGRLWRVEKEAGARVSFVLAGGERVEAYPPLAEVAGGAPAVVMLHGMCSSARATCEWWSRAARGRSWLVCPEGNGSCGGDARDWTGTSEERAAYIDAVLAALALLEPKRFDVRRNHVLLGFSRGSWVARDLAYARPGRYRGVMLVGAAIALDAARLRDSGVVRVVMASGELDGARKSMELTSAILAMKGLPTRFVSTGRIYHWLPENFGDYVAAAVPWLLGEPAVAATD